MKKLLFTLLLAMSLLAACTSTKDKNDDQTNPSTNSTENNNLTTPDTTTESGATTTPSDSNTNNTSSSTNDTNSGSGENNETATTACTKAYTFSKTLDNEKHTVSLNHPCDWKVTEEANYFTLSSPDQPAKLSYGSGDIGLQGANLENGTIVINDKSYPTILVKPEGKDKNYLMFIQTKAGKEEYNFTLEYQTEAQRAQLMDILKTVKFSVE